MKIEFDRAAMTSALIERARVLLADIPDQISPALAAETDPAKCEKIIESAFLEALAGFETSWRLQ
jgi:hypothetical protein